MDADHDAAMQHITIPERVAVGMLPMRNLQECHLYLHHAGMGRMTGFAAIVRSHSCAEAIGFGCHRAACNLTKRDLPNLA